MKVYCIRKHKTIRNGVYVMLIYVLLSVDDIHYMHILYVNIFALLFLSIPPRDQINSLATRVSLPSSCPEWHLYSDCPRGRGVRDAAEILHM